MQIQITRRCVIEEESRSARQKISLWPFKPKCSTSDKSWSTRILKRLSKPNLPKVLEPSKFQLPMDFIELYLHQLSGSRNQLQLHPLKNGFIQCFPQAPKQLTTLRLGVICVWAKKLSKGMELERQKQRIFQDFLSKILLSISWAFIVQVKK